MPLRSKAIQLAKALEPGAPLRTALLDVLAAKQFADPKQRKKVLMAVYKKFKGVGDAYIRGGKHKVYWAKKGENYTLEDLSDDELIDLARGVSVLRPGEVSL